MKTTAVEPIQQPLGRGFEVDGDEFHARRWLAVVGLVLTLARIDRLRKP
jgi:hypothetical protein